MKKTIWVLIGCAVLIGVVVLIGRERAQETQEQATTPRLGSGQAESVPSGESLLKEGSAC